jgi:hypothetical protein
MELSPGRDHSHDESDHEKQQLTSVGTSDMMVEEKECSEQLHSVPNVVQDLPGATGTEPHLPLVTNMISGRRARSR